MKFNKKYLRFPQIVPIKLLTVLQRAGIRTTQEVHEHILNDSLLLCHGIGPKNAIKIMKYYTSLYHI
jgi:hypothetical protein